MRRAALLPYLLLCSSCAIAFGAGARAAPAPAKFDDIENSRVGEEEREMTFKPPGAPTFGMSLVAGGQPLDAGDLPKPPLPIVAPL